MNQYEARKRAREDGVKTFIDHERRQGREPTQQAVEKFVHQRADHVDKKRDRNIKD
jgi:hypothetical protein